MNREWVLKRRFSAGNTTALSALAMSDSMMQRAGVRAKYVLGGAVRAAAGSARVMVGSILGSARHQARGLRTAYRGLGLLAGSTGYRYLEYRR